MPKKSMPLAATAALHPMFELPEAKTILIKLKNMSVAKRRPIITAMII